MKEIVTAGKRRQVHNRLRNDYQEHNSSKQNYPRPYARNPRKQPVQRLGVKQEKWNRRTAEQSSGSEKWMLRGRIHAKPEVEGDRSTRNKPDHDSEA